MNVDVQESFERLQAIMRSIHDDLYLHRKLNDIPGRNSDRLIELFKSHRNEMVATMNKFLDSVQIEICGKTDDQSLYLE